MLQVNSYNSLVNKTDLGPAKRPDGSLIKTGKIANWQDSLLARSLAPAAVRRTDSFLRIAASGSWLHSVVHCEKRAHVITSQVKIKSSSFVSFGRRVVVFLAAAPWTRVGRCDAFACVWLVSAVRRSHSLSVSKSESDHCTGLSFPLRWAYSITAV